MGKDDILTQKAFLDLLKHKPVHITNRLDDASFAAFRKRGSFSPSLELYFARRSKRLRGLYFEILDLDGYKDGDLIPISSDRRKSAMKADFIFESPNEVAKKIDSCLKLLYSGKLDRLSRACRCSRRTRST